MALPKLEDCKPGFAPTEYNVIIAAEETEEVRASGLIIPPSLKDTNDMACMKGLLVSISPLAFNYDTWPAEARKPQPGDHIVFAKYAGILVTGEDGRQVRVCKDRDVMAVYGEQADV